MSVPLDRLYNFLHDVARRNDALIYRFLPHGSRKISDLKNIKKINNQRYFRVVDSTKTKFIFMHDQEPLNFDLYTEPGMFDQVLESNRFYFDPILTPELVQQCRELLAQIMPRVNLRIAAFEYRQWFRPVLLVHSEKRSKQLCRYESENFLGVYWWSHAVIARDWFRFAELDCVLEEKTTAVCDFLIYNRAWSGTREYRIKLTELLVKHNLVPNCLTWFSPVDDGTHYQDHQFKNTKFQIDNYDLEQFFSPSAADSTASADYCTDDYRSTNIELVLETLFDDDRLHLTEKILRPIACGQPFMLAATAHSLEYLRSYGFETFGLWIDETYDTIEDPVQRLEAIVQEMKRIASLSDSEKTIMYAGLRAISARNKKLFFSAEWHQSIINEFKTNLDLACEQFDQLTNFKI